MAKKRNKKSDKSQGDVIVRGVNLTRDFKCHLCGNCCRGPGYVALTRKDEVNISEYLNIPISEFRRDYCAEENDGSFILIDREGSEDCIFLQEDNTCAIHVVKPEQCATFPYDWRSPDFFKTCEGFLTAKRKLNEVNVS
jgi:Fe-S-cluster containining protein